MRKHTHTHTHTHSDREVDIYLILHPFYSHPYTKHKIAVRREGRWLKGVKERCTKKGRKIYITTKEKSS